MIYSSKDLARESNYCMKKHQKYEYELPMDENKLMADAIALACVDALKDGPNCMSKEIIEEKARRICKQIKTICNNFDAFSANFTGNYTLMYITKQKQYKNNPDFYKNDIDIMLSCGGFGNYYEYIQSVARKGVIEAGGQV